MYALPQSVLCMLHPGRTRPTSSTTLRCRNYIWQSIASHALTPTINSNVHATQLTMRPMRPMRPQGYERTQGRRHPAAMGKVDTNLGAQSSHNCAQCCTASASQQENSRRQACTTYPSNSTTPIQGLVEGLGDAVHRRTNAASTAEKYGSR